MDELAKKQYRMRAASEEDRTTWIAAINEHTNNLTHDLQINQRPKTSFRLTNLTHKMSLNYGTEANKFSFGEKNQGELLRQIRQHNLTSQALAYHPELK